MNTNHSTPSVKGSHLARLRVWLRNLPHLKTARAYRCLTLAMQRDPDYAHSWQCNIACPLMDEGMSHADANKAADRLMAHLFGVNPPLLPPRTIDPSQPTIANITDELDKHSRLAAEARSLLHNGGAGPNLSQLKRCDAILRTIAGL